MKNPSHRVAGGAGEDGYHSDPRDDKDLQRRVTGKLGGQIEVETRGRNFDEIALAFSEVAVILWASSETLALSRHGESSDELVLQ
jgi:hypothetical protein